MTHSRNHPPTARGDLRVRGPRAAATLLLAASTCLAACGGEPQPAAVSLSVNPNRVWYHTGQTIDLSAAVSDVMGEPIAGVPLVWSVEPSQAATLEAGGELSAATYVLEQEGRAVFTACVAPDGSARPSLCAALAVNVDDGMPFVELQHPRPGQELDDADGILVRGSVSDSSMSRVYVNGQPALVDERGNFELFLEPMFGVNHLVVSGSDGRTDATEVELDVLWAPSYSLAVSEDGTPEVALPDGLTLWLGQDFFDDGTPLDPNARPVMTRDLADVLELIVDSVEVEGLLPDPVIDRPPNFTLRAANAQIREITAELDLTEDGADLFFRFGDVSVQTSGNLVVEDRSLPLTGTVRGAAIAFAEITVRQDAADAPLEVTMQNLTLGIESIRGEFVSEETAAIFQVVEGVLRRTLEGLVLDAMRSTLEETVPQVLLDALGSVDGALAGQEVTLDNALFSPVTIQLDGRIGRISSQYRTALQATLEMAVGTTTPATQQRSLGVARLSTNAMGPRFFRDGSLKLGVRLALLNGLLHALWNSGLLEIDATALLPSSLSGLISTAEIHGRLPPVVRPPLPGEDHDLILTLGQLELDLGFMGEPVRFGVRIEAGADISLVDNRLAFDLAEEPTITVWTILAPSNRRLLTNETVADVLRDLWPTLRESVVSGLAFELPIPAIGDLGGFAPDVAGLELSISMTDRLRVRDGVLVLDAELIGRLP